MRTQDLTSMLAGASTNGTSNNLSPVIGVSIMFEGTIGLGTRFAEADTGVPARHLINLPMLLDTCHGERSSSHNKPSNAFVVALTDLSVSTSALRASMLTTASTALKSSKKLRRIGGPAPWFLKQQAVPGLQPETAPVKSHSA